MNLFIKCYTSTFHCYCWYSLVSFHLFSSVILLGIYSSLYLGIYLQGVILILFSLHTLYFRVNLLDNLIVLCQFLVLIGLDKSCKGIFNFFYLPKLAYYPDTHILSLGSSCTIIFLEGVVFNINVFCIVDHYVNEFIIKVYRISYILY